MWIIFFILSTAKGEALCTTTKGEEDRWGKAKRMCLC